MTAALFEIFLNPNALRDASHGKDMEKIPKLLWKLRLAAAGFGVLALIVVFSISLFVSNDIRLMYGSGAVVLFCAAIWLGRRQQDWRAALLLVAPLVAAFSYLVLTEVPILWPNLVLWAVAAAIGLVLVRAARTRRAHAIALLAVLLIGSTWYCAWYVPTRLARLFNRVTDTSAPTFVLQPVSKGPVAVTPKRGKILAIDFFSTTCAPCIAELPALMAVRADLVNDPDVEFVLVASDRGNDTPERFRSFIEKRHITLPLAFDVGGKAHDGFGLRGVPALVVLDRNGKVRLTHTGYNAAETSFRRDLVQFLKSL
jgi:thiol-disulfide isomerase/thioredoxin